MAKTTMRRNFENSYFCVHCNQQTTMNSEEYGTGNEEVDDLLSRVAANEATYASVDEISSACQYLSSIDRAQDADRLMQWGLNLHVGDTTLLMVYATLLIDEHNVDKAESLLSYIGDSAKTHFYYHLALGKLNCEREQYLEARSAFEVSATIAPDELRAKAILDAATTFGRYGQYDYALEFYERAPKEDLWGDASFIFDYGYTLSGVGRGREAVAAYQRSAELDPFNEHSWFNLGVEFAKLGDNDKALDAFATAADVNPAYPSPFFNKGYLQVASGMYEDAIVSLTEYISLAEEKLDFTAYQLLAECWDALGNDGLANRFLTLTVAKDAESSSAWFALGQNYLKNGPNSVAMAALEIAIGINPNVVEYYYSYAQAHLNANNVAECIRMLEKGVSLRTSDVLAWFEIVRLRMGEMGEKVPPIRRYFAEMKKKYGSPPALTLVEGYVEYRYLGEKERGASLAKDALGASAKLAEEARQHPSLEKFLTQINLRV